MVITNKVESKLLPKQTLLCQASLPPKAGNTEVIRSEPDDEFAFDAEITGGGGGRSVF